MADEVNFAITSATITDEAQSSDMQKVEDFMEVMFPGMPVFVMVARPDGVYGSNVETYCSGPLGTMGEMLQMIGQSLRNRAD